MVLEIRDKVVAAPGGALLSYAIRSVADWLRRRFEALNLNDADRIELILNPWNETHGLGLQSVTVRVANKLLPGEWRHPTIGIVANDLVGGEDRKIGLAAFSVDEGKSERITALSNGLIMGATPSSRVSRNTVIPRRLSDGEVIQVDGPNAVLTLLQLQNPTPEQIREAVNSGVYACEFLSK